MSSTAPTAPAAPDSPLARRIAELDLEALRTRFRDNDEFIAIPGFMPAAGLEPLLAALPALEPRIHRNFIPGHKKGGSTSRYDLDAVAPAYPAFYNDPALLDFLRRLTGQDLKICPPDDPHTYALYYYTEPGDHIGWHYDTSYYKGSRYTILLGLVDDSSCRLEWELHREDVGRETVHGGTALSPGMLVVFNGDKLWHRVTPAAAGDRRVALTLEYVTSHAMHPLRRFVSNMKDAIAYFGFRQVFARGARR
ncbi:MAG: 2OG-Fe(II) oxygenase [Gammaproteobacteria bacterium]|nr:2OG-Fe(II) oxygenase [Gammaproteobacteria bacterium]